MIEPADDRPTVAESLISARLLMLQSKRLILATLERRFRKEPLDGLRARVEQLRDETESAQDHYARSLLRWGTAQTPEFWPVAYHRLIEMADQLSTRLRRASAGVPPSARYELAAEVEMLETLVDDWRQSVRASVAPVS
jgi:hypothetical protein